MQCESHYLKFWKEVYVAGDELREERGWKLFFLLPRMLLSRPPRGGHISKDKLSGRFAEFGRGHWLGLIRVGMDCAEDSATGSRRGVVDDIDRRAARAKMLVQLGRVVI